RPRSCTPSRRCPKREQRLRHPPAAKRCYCDVTGCQALALGVTTCYHGRRCQSSPRSSADRLPPSSPPPLAPTKSVSLDESAPEPAAPVDGGNGRTYPRRFLHHPPVRRRT